MVQKAPGKVCGAGLSLIELMDMFPTEDAAREWIESVIWSNGRCCGKCGGTKSRAGSSIEGHMGRSSHYRAEVNRTDSAVADPAARSR